MSINKSEYFCLLMKKSLLMKKILIYYNLLSRRKIPEKNHKKFYVHIYIFKNNLMTRNLDFDIIINFI